MNKVPVDRSVATSIARSVGIPVHGELVAVVVEGTTLLLDSFPGAVVAYSAARRLSGTYTGALFRVRRSSDNAEQDIGYTAENLMDESALTTFVGANNGFVVTLYDQSGNGRNMTQATAANQPTVVSSGTIQRSGDGLRPSMVFGGTPFLSTSSFAWGSDGVAVYTAGRITSNAGAAVYLELGTNVSTANGSFGMIWPNSGGSDLMGWRVRGTTLPATVTLAHTATPTNVIWEASGDISASVRYLERDDSTSTATSVASMGTGDLGTYQLNLGARQGGTVFFNGMSGELVCYGTNEARAVDTDMVAFWNAPVPPLDAVTSPVFAGSSARLLRSAYTGALIRVRRSSDNAEQDIGFVPFTRLLDEDALTTFVGASDGHVVTLYDQSGNGRNMTQTTASLQPRIVIAGTVQRMGTNSRPAPDFDSDSLATASFAMGSGEVAAFLAMRKDTTPTYEIPLTYGNIFTTARTWHIEDFTSEIAWRPRSGVESGAMSPFFTSATATVDLIAVGLASLAAGTRQFQCNGRGTISSAVSFTATTANWTTSFLRAGADGGGGGGSNPLNGKIGEVIVYNAVSKASASAQVQSNMTGFWGVI